MDSNIKTSVEAARHREQQRAAGEPLGCPCCGVAVTPWRGLCECDNECCPVTHIHFTDDWNTRPAQEQADRALIELAAKEQRLTEILMPLLKYGSDIYNNGIARSISHMPNDAIQRLNAAYKILGGE
jgi:hypothetical protein